MRDVRNARTAHAHLPRDTAAHALLTGMGSHWHSPCRSVDVMKSAMAVRDLPSALSER